MTLLSKAYLLYNIVIFHLKCHFSKILNYCNLQNLDFKQNWLFSQLSGFEGNIYFNRHFDFCLKLKSPKKHQPIDGSYERDNETEEEKSAQKTAKKQYVAETWGSDGRQRDEPKYSFHRIGNYSMPIGPHTGNGLPVYLASAPQSVPWNRNQKICFFRFRIIPCQPENIRPVSPHFSGYLSPAEPCLA